MKSTYNLVGEGQTLAFGSGFGEHLTAGDVICLSGPLGAGKTTFARGMALGLKIPSRQVTSPTYTLNNTYRGTKIIHHFDLYRLQSDNELESVGFYEALDSDAIVWVEWPERVSISWPKATFWLYFDYNGPSARSLVIEAENIDKNLERFLVEKT